METSRDFSWGPRVVKEAPFTYGGRRRPVFDTDESLATAMDATRSAQRCSNTPTVPHDQSEGHRAHRRYSGKRGSPPRDMAAAVRDRARLSWLLEEDTLQFATAGAEAVRLVSFSMSSTPGTSLTSFPQLPVDPVPGCLRALRSTRSARAWSTLASGCLAEAAQLSEKDNDIVAWAACFILSGDPQRGLMLLESYVVATCVVVHEVLTGVLGRLPKCANPLLKRKNRPEGRGARSGSPVQDDSAHPYVQRKCLDRHNQVLMAWMRYRTTFSEHLPVELVCYDVNVNRTPEAVVRQVVLQSMQLVDAMEVHRWYIVALMLFTPVDISGCSDVTSGDGQSRKRGGGGDAGGNSGGTCHPYANTSPSADRVKDTDSVFTQARGVTSPSSAATSAARKAKSAGGGYHALSNLWFRYFFALDEPITPAVVAEGLYESSQGTRGRRDADGGPATPLATGGYAAKTPEVESSPSKTPFQVNDVSNSNSPCFTPGPGGTQLASVDHPNDGPPVSPPRSSVAAEAEAKEKVREGSFAFQPAGRFVKKMSWFWDNSKSSPSNAALHAASVVNGDSQRATAEPTWHLPATVALDQEQTCSLLLSHREEWDVYFITAVTAFYTHHYRTCMIAASRFLHLVESRRSSKGSYNPLEEEVAHHPSQNMENVGASSGMQASATSALPRASMLLSTMPSIQPYHLAFALFLRAWSALQIGERVQAGKDIVTLLEEKEDTLGYHVGCALALYGLPLPQAKDTLLAATHNFTNAVIKTVGPGAPAATSFSLLAQGYLYLLAEAVHATTLLQLGLVQQTIDVARSALKHAEASKLTEEDTLPLGTLRDVLVTAATAMEDSNAILDIPLSPHRLAYIAVCPAFFGGLCAGGIRVKPHSAVHRILYPQHVPLYWSTQLVIPFHMNRAMFLFNSGQVDGAWDDVCCAVAAVDELAGSVNFAFSDCFSLRVYHFAMTVGMRRLEVLLAADLEAAKVCLANPNDERAIEEKDIRLHDNELLIKEILRICKSVMYRMQRFFPHARETELFRSLISILRGEREGLSQAVVLSRRYPCSPAAQNVLTMALYFDYHFPEAVDNAYKSLQMFPHSAAVINMHRILQVKHSTYNFNYRKLLPIRYKPGSHDRLFTKRMIIVLILLAANLVILCLTIYVNVPSVTNIPDGLRYLAVRLQLPTVIPFFFAALFVIHATVAALTPKNLISVLMSDLFFVNTPFNRALYCLRCIPLVNVVNALLVSTLGNNFLFDSGSETFVLYFFLAVLFMPFTTRIWLLPSVDEPDVDIMVWLALLSLDSVIALFVVIPHIVMAFFEPYMFVLFYFFAPVERPGNEKGFTPPSSSIRRRLVLHARDSKYMSQRFATSSGSRFPHIIILKWLYIWSHCSMETRFLSESQLEADCYRAFPYFEGEEAKVLYAQVPQEPLCAAVTAVEEVAPRRSITSIIGVLHKQPPRGKQRSSPAASVSISEDAVGAHVNQKGRQRTVDASLSSSTYPSYDTSTGSASASYSYSTSSSLLSPCSGSSNGDYRASRSDDDSGDGDYDEVLPPEVRTVTAMRWLIGSTARERQAKRQHAASFVRPNRLSSIGAALSSQSDEDSGKEEGWRDAAEGDVCEDKDGGAHRAGTTGHEAVNGGDNTGSPLPTSLFPEETFGPHIGVHRGVHHRSQQRAGPSHNVATHTQNNNRADRRRRPNSRE
ncbi:hypothetical protein ABL78_5891 [Leptomonas seymouri]|uniref:Uncharacterized protein n=1 Tax=Leptomonas seymouri TaxID=5684 RepID=A0A0N1IIT8_LEPSE|nr:hypothetical protein ABL78_5891 [Leptomonas seymouri]|eukprot:KPI85053.1 hypothetical protein ABL78_5891 [Leptomonas seymouri]